MSKANQYKTLLATAKQELRRSKIAHENLVDQLTAANHKCGLLSAELGRIRTRKWWQFWKFFKRNQII